ncbi:MAG: redoxin domain-containing protein [Rhodopseudomonas sp.]|nr:redoxin domain-containing protein [Rhodopseudomonas sp.]
MRDSLQLRHVAQRPRSPLSAIVIAALIAVFCIASGPAKAWNSTDMTGALPPLDFTMTRASDGQTVTAADFKDKIVLLYFGYTFCPDVCPATLMNITQVLKSLGPKADDVRVLFVTVDPNRDTLQALKDFTGAFAPQIVGLRGSANQLAALAKRYRVAYSVTPGGNGKPYEVTHGSAVYAFNRAGDIKLLFTGLTTPDGKLDGVTADMRALVAGAGSDSWWRRMLSWF